MRRYKILVEYDGRAFHGWQAQKGQNSAQEALQRAFFAYAQERTHPYGAGRTDAGVHALGQVAHLDFSKEKDPQEMKKALNFHLKPQPIAVLEASRADPTFHARFSAKARLYLYKIKNRASPLTYQKGLFWHVRPHLEEAAMREASEVFLGSHDFTTFRAAQCQAASPVKTLDALEIVREGEEIRIAAKARSFLHHQVRSLVGALKYVGEGKWTPQQARRALRAKDRACCPPIAPAHGLYLARVFYEGEKEGVS